MQTDLWQYYQAQAPGQVAVVGADIWDGTPAQLQTFRNITGASYPLLLNAAGTTGGDMFLLYGDRDNYVVIDRERVVRFSARSQGYNYGAALDVPRLRALVDSLLASPTGVGDGPATETRVTPNPGRGPFDLTFAPGARDAAALATVRVLDLEGRCVATVYQGMTSGTLHATWDGRATGGTRCPPGLYLVRAEIAGRSIVRRIVLLR